MPRKRNRSNPEILAGLKAKARAHLEPKDPMTPDEDTIAIMRKPCVRTLTNVSPPTVVIVRHVPKEGGGWQVETLDLDGEWTPFAGNDHHVVR